MNNRQLPDSDIWFVRAEGRNTLARHFLEQGVVSMGWGIGPIGYDDPIDGIIGRLRKYIQMKSPELSSQGLLNSRDSMTKWKWAMLSQQFQHTRLKADYATSA